MRIHTFDDRTSFFVFRSVKVAICDLNERLINTISAVEICHPDPSLLAPHLLGGLRGNADLVALMS